MRLTGGTLRSRRLPNVPKRGVRPTPARVKESLFAILSTRSEDAVVLDLFAGSGALGFEALSRGASFVTFVESNPGVADLLREASGELGVEKQVEILTMRAERAVTRLERKYDLVFADPPYEMGFPAQPLGTLRTRDLFSEEAVVVFEHSGHSSPETPGFEVTREERYGDVVIAFLKPEANS
ncbi:MAG TPA: 16S rRNA (guanine(966)-N(2))-methyltransferase RsmD [Candidatus Baltobacteraceae bacterium]